MGSLPHDSIDDAIELAFAVDIPYLPELYARGERMIEQALVEDPARSHAAFGAFIDRIRVEGRPWAKVQIAGPVVLGEALRRQGRGESELGRALEGHAKKVAHLIGAVQDAGARALLFFDEPTLETAETMRPLSAALEHAQSFGARTGVHCCGAVPWSAALALPSEVFAFDLSSPAPPLPAIEAYAKRGGWWGLGLVRTHSPGVAEATEIPASLEPYLEQSLLMPACGLGTRTVEEAEAVFRTLATSAASIRAAAMT